ncbi:MAG: phosphoenolpyruvate carboxykinase (ATP) [Pseudomonadota bacterium]|nr:phosphoenolpyruvate carboxykinase (ATP) [Pseudomonadota bacterium]
MEKLASTASGSDLSPADTNIYEKALEELGIINLDGIYWNLSTAQLYEGAIRRREAHLAHLGPLVTRTGSFTGRAPNDKFIVDDPVSHCKVWWGKVNKPFPEHQFDALYEKVCLFLEGQEVFVQDLLVGADPDYEMPIRVVTQMAWHSLFARNMFIHPQRPGRTPEHEDPQFTVVHAPHFHAQPTVDGTNSEAFIIVNFARRLVLIGGTQYAGEIKKSIFSVMNYLLPQQGVLTMHAAANVSEKGDSAILFGLSGTGKTTLSADPERKLIGDDEHAWGDQGIFNLEGGCYAKVIRLSERQEPLIYHTTRRFGTILENVSMDFRDRKLDLDDDRLTENTRASYPISHIPNTIVPGLAGHPRDIVMLTCDAFGVLPPIARLTPEQAMYHFISGYTAKVAGTETGITEPQVTFSTCFGAPFMSLDPSVYSGLLGRKIQEHGVRCWLINTGWSGGPYGIGKRMDIHHTRAMLRAALDGELDDVPTTVDPIFRFLVPERCPGIQDEVLQPANTWPAPEAYRAKAMELARAFHENFRQFESHAGESVMAAEPRLSYQ